VAEATADSFNIGLMNDAIDAATAALNAEPSENVPIPDHASMLAFACGREPWATWLKSGGPLESAHLELSDLMLAVLAQWGQSTPPAQEDLATDQLMAANLSALLIEECGLHSPGSSIYDLLQRAAAMLVNYGLPARPVTLPAPKPGDVRELHPLWYLVEFLEGHSSFLRQTEPLSELAEILSDSATLLQQQEAELATLRGAPVVVCDRTPKEGDCDAEGGLWIWSTAGAMARWQLVYLKFVGNVSFTHWLPAHALPLPAFTIGQESQ